MAKKVRKKKVKAEKSGEERKGGDNTQSLKTLLVFMGLLCAVALGAFLYIKVKVVRDAETNLRNAERHHYALAERLAQLQAEVTDIIARKVEEVKVPTEHVQRVARAFPISRSSGTTLANHIQVSQAGGGRWRSSELYGVKRVNIRFVELQGFQLPDIYKVMAALERSNPKVQIEEIDFGKRDPPTEAGETYWRPNGMIVRYFVPLRKDGDS